MSELLKKYGLPKELLELRSRRRGGVLPRISSLNLIRTVSQMSHAGSRVNNDPTAKNFEEHSILVELGLASKTELTERRNKLVDPRKDRKPKGNRLKKR